MLNQGENKVFIEGILSEVNVREGEFTKNGSKVPYLSGEIIVKVNEVLDGGMVENDVPVSFFVTKYTNSGAENPAYKSVNDLRSNFVSIAASDIDTADRIRITSGTIQENAYIGRQEQTVSFPKVNASFFQKISKADCEPQTRFQNTICIANIRDEVDRENEPTGALVVTGVLVQYGGRADIVEYKVTNKNAIDHIQTNWQKGDTVKICGKLRFSKTTFYTEEEVGFGEPIRTPHTRNTSDLIITSGSAGSLEGDQAYDTNEIAKALNERKVRLEEMKRKVAQKNIANARPTKGADLGF